MFRWLRWLKRKYYVQDIYFPLHRIKKYFVVPEADFKKYRVITLFKFIIKHTALAILFFIYFTSNAFLLKPLFYYTLILISLILTFKF